MADVEVVPMPESPILVTDLLLHDQKMKVGVGYTMLSTIQTVIL